MKGLDPVVEALHLWQLDSAYSGHLGDDELCRLAENGGLKIADSSALLHLSKCPLCLQEWSAWRKATTVTEASVRFASHSPKDVVGYGFLQAADSAAHNPFTLKSECGRFSVDVLPQVDSPDRVLMVFKVTDPNKTGYEDQTALLRDKRGEVFLRGRIHNGQFARNVENLELFDLTTWTVIFARNND